MWGANLSDMPRFYNFAQAHKFYRSTKPVRTTGAIPLRSNRRQHDQYDIVTGDDSHGAYVACRHYGTELVKIYENGNFGIYPYNSRTSRDFICAVSPFRVASVLDQPVLNDAHYLTGAEVKLRPAEGRQPSRGCPSASWVIDNPKAAVGVPIGAGRGYIDKKAGDLMRAAKKQRKAFCLFAGVEDISEIRGLREYRELCTAADLTHEAQTWRKGDQIPLWLVATTQLAFDHIDRTLRHEIKRHPRQPRFVTDWFDAQRLLKEDRLRDPHGVLDRPDWVHGIIV